MPDKNPAETLSLSAKEIFLEAVEQHAPESWDAFLETACAGRCVAARSRRTAVEGPCRGAAANQYRGRSSDGGLPPITEEPGATVGSYKLREQIGEGGFGVVYVAEQTDPVQRKVALKIIKLGMDTREVIARFEAERQALAIMDHPNIAKVLDGGAAASARIS